MPRHHGDRTVDGHRRHGVVFVHGVGTQKKSDTLLDFGWPLLQWLTRRHTERGEATPHIRAIELGFVPSESGDGESVPRATIAFPNGDT